MKCPYCGGEVGLEEKVCSYCGRPNEQAVQHQQNMASYRRRYAETEASVVTKAARYAQIVPRTVVILLLLIATVVMAVIAENAYYFPENMRRRAAERQPEAVLAVLDGYLENREYLSMASCFNYYDIRTYNGPFADYADDIRWTVEYYSDFVISMEKLFLHGDRDSWLKYGATSDIQRLCSALDCFLDSWNNDMRDVQNESHRAALEDMKNSVTEMMRVFLGIDREEFDGFVGLSENKKAAWIEEVLLGA